jgi:hypothetical protein
MRNFQPLDHVHINTDIDSIQLESTDSQNEPVLALRREGIYVTISASFGPLEIALRPRYEDLVRTLGRLQSVEGLHTTRQVGTAQAYLAMGLTAEGALLLRPTIVADATGHFSLNLEIAPAARQALYEWLRVGVTEARA